MRAFAFASFIVLTASACVCWAVVPTPAVVPAPGQWTIDTEFTHPQQITLGTGPGGKPERFWYSLITLTNKTGAKADFYAKCELKTDTFQIIPAGKSVPPDVFVAIKKRHEAVYPFIESLAKTGYNILQGEDNAKDIAVIWPDFDAKAGKIKIFITGLSNETASVNHPIAKDKDGAPLKIFLRKTLELTYALESDSAQRSDANLIFKSQRWIMR